MALATSTDDPTEIECGIKIKKEKECEEDIVSSAEANNLIVNNSQLSNLQSRDITITVASQEDSTSSVIKPIAQTSKKTSEDNSSSSRPSSPPPDYKSICKAFGWVTIGPVHLPFIMRGENKFIATRILNDKIIRTYINILPDHIFQLTHVDSFFMTEAEIILYNEINEFHCDLQFGYSKFTSSDVVVDLNDCINYYDFLETCKNKLNLQGADHSYNSKCGFYNIKNKCVPYIRKGSRNYVPVKLTTSTDCVETATEWDKSYFKLLYGKVADSFEKLCCVEDLESVYGEGHFEEVWVDIRGIHFSDLHSSNESYSKYESSVIQSPTTTVEDDQKIRDKITEMHEKESVFSTFLGYEKFLNVNPSLSRTAHLSPSSELQNGLSSISTNDKANMFPLSIENLLVATPAHNYPYPINYSNQYNSHLPTSIPELERYRQIEENMALTSNRMKSFPPPPPLVRLSGSRSSSIPSVPDSSLFSKSASMYPYLQTSSNPWLSRILEADWMREEERLVLQQKDTPENLSRRFSENDLWCPTSLSSSSNLNGAGSSNLVRSNSNPAGVRDSYEITTSSLCRDDRMLHPHSGSPRLLAGPGPPPHYPTPPQSSPLQPISLMDCSSVPVVPDLYSTRTTPNGLDLCSPPPSPEIRTALSSSPRGSLVSSQAYHPHIARLVQVDTRFLLAINIEPLKYSSHLAVPLSELVTKFLRGSSPQSCQMMLETYGLQLYECTRLQHEAFAKHGVSIETGSKMVLLNDLKSYMQHMRHVQLVDTERQKDANCDFTTSESPLSKRWCSNAREC